MSEFDNMNVPNSEKLLTPGLSSNDDGLVHEETHDGPLYEPPVSQRQFVGFWLLGLINNFSYVVMLSASEDILVGLTGAVLACDIVPALLVKSSAPFWAHHVSYRSKIILCGVLAALSFLCTSLLDASYFKLLGVCFASCSSGLGEYSILQLTSYFPAGTITAWSSGTGFAGIAGFGWYLVLHTVLGITPQKTLFLGLIFPVAWLFTYFGLVDKAVQEYTAAASQQQDDTENAAFLSTENTVAKSHNMTVTMSFQERLQRMKGLVRYMVPLAVVYFAEYTINSGITNTFETADMSRKTFYVSAGLVYQAGVFVSRSSRKWLRLKTLWPLPVLQCVNIALFLAQSLWHVVDYSYLLFPLVFWEGLLGGAAYVNVFAEVALNVDPKYKEFSAGVVSLSDSFGIMCASGVAIWLEGVLLQRNGF